MHNLTSQENYTIRLLWDRFDKRGVVTNVFSFRANVADYQNAYRVVLYPGGSNYVPLSYSIGSAVILASTPHPDACYRWIRALAKHPELFYAMPARHSQIADSTLVNKEGSDAVAAYKQIEQQLSLPNAITVPSYVVTFPELIIERWLFQTFSAYVLKNADLDSALQDAQSQSLGFLACVADVPAYDPTDPQNNYLGNIKTCAVKLDPTAGVYFGPSS